MSRLLEIGGRRVPFLRWSFVRMLLGMRRLTTEWQVGDGREEALRAYVLDNAPAGDLDAAIDVIDEFAYERSFLINVATRRERSSTARSRAASRGWPSSSAPIAATAPCASRARWGQLRPGAIVVADNIKTPGAPEYHAFMREHEGGDWRTVEHEAHVEYQSLLKDIVLESEYVAFVRPRP